jgi:probable addiction module antidote protein
MGEITMVNEARSVPYRSADFLKSAEDIAEYLNAALEDGDVRVLLMALRNSAEAIGGMTELARRTGLSREALYRTLSEDGNPRLSSLKAILGAFGVELAVRPRAA